MAWGYGPERCRRHRPLATVEDRLLARVVATLACVAQFDVYQVCEPLMGMGKYRCICLFFVLSSLHQHRQARSQSIAKSWRNFRSQPAASTRN